jgi:hypothetical protein
MPILLLHRREHDYFHLLSPELLGQMQVNLPVMHLLHGAERIHAGLSLELY